MALKKLCVAVVVLTGACAPDMEDRTSVAQGARLFAANCAVCHGSDARGYQGPSEEIEAPPDLTTLSIRNGGRFPDVAVLAQIFGMAPHDDSERMMPQFGNIDLGPTVIVEMEDGIGTPVQADLLALSEYLKSIQRQP